MSGTGQVHHGPHEGARAASANEDAFVPAMDAAMARMMAAMHARPVSDPDRDFLAMMIPHHEGAVEMARLVLVHGRDPLTRQLAQEIIAGQAVEIAAMRARLKALGSTGEEYPALGGTRGDAPSR